MVILFAAALMVIIALIVCGNLWYDVLFNKGWSWQGRVFFGMVALLASTLWVLMVHSTIVLYSMGGVK